jgi:hypothetical protein
LKEKSFDGISLQRCCEGEKRFLEKINNLVNDEIISKMNFERDLDKKGDKYVR